jgi:hypothetical protein
MRLPLLLLLLFSLLSLLAPSLAARSSATSFCKCICFNNSTIIALNPPSSSKTKPTPSPTPDAALLPRADDEKKQHHLTCADCNRAFCLDYNLPICKDAREEDVFTTCFQRDSVKDETVVIVFLIATAGLLGWAIIKPFVTKAREGGIYASLPTGRAAGGSGISGVRGGGPSSRSRGDVGEEDTFRDEGEEDVGLNR